MPGLKPNAKTDRKPAPPKGPRKPRPHGLARARMTPTHRVEHAMDNCPDCGTQLSGGWTHRTREVIDLPQVPAKVTEHVYMARICPGCRRQRAQPDRHAAGRGAAAHPQRPVVSGHRASVALQRGGHRERHPSHGAAGTTGRGREPGPHPRQPGSPRRRNRLASERGQRLRVDFQHPHRTLLPANATSCGGVGAKQSWTRR